jgi:leucyl-tRNA synthetase
LKDLGYVSAEEPFKKLINQGHIQGVSKFIYRLDYGLKNENLPSIFISKDVCDLWDEFYVLEQIQKEFSKNKIKVDSHSFTPSSLDQRVNRINIDINLVDNEVLRIENLRNWRAEFKNAIFITNREGKYICGSEVEKMSKSKHNVVNPDDIIDNYGADTLRLYEMFLGPLELSKPWNTNGIDGVFKFLRKFWNLFHDAQGNWKVSDAAPTRDELKILHKTLKKVEQDINNFSFNTTVSEFMICVNELSALKCNKKGILEPLVIALSAYAPHIAEELWEKLGYADSILHAKFPAWNEEYLKESSFEYPISINGKVRTKMEFALDMPKEDIEKVVLASELVNKWTEGKPPKKVIVVPGKIVNVVI